MTNDSDLARRVDAAQSILQTPAALEAQRLESALAASCAAIAEVMALRDPSSHASSRVNGCGHAIFAGRGSPLTQGLAMGLEGAVRAADLDALEAHLRPDGNGAIQLEISPFVDPTLTALLAARTYRVHEWQLVWTRDVADAHAAPERATPGLVVRRVRAGEEDAYLRAVMAGFLESNDVPEEALALMRPAVFATAHESYLALIDGEPVGGASLSWNDGVAFVNGSGVRSPFRRRGAQGALIRARLDRARELGCDMACSTTLPGTSSRRNMERYGFRVAYPKVLMLGEG